MRVCLPTRFELGSARVGGAPPSVKELDETDPTRAILFDRLFLAGTVLAKSNYGKVCDFTFWTAQKQLGTVTAQNKAKAVDNEYVAVDTSRRTDGNTTNVWRRNFGPQPLVPVPQHKKAQFVTGKKDKLSAAYTRPQPINRTAMVRARAVVCEFACAVDSAWQLVADVSAQALNNSTLTGIKLSDVKWMGRVNEFDRSFDSVGPRSPVDLPIRYSELARLPEYTSHPVLEAYSHCTPGTRGDPVLGELILESEKNGNEDVQIIITDQLLATLMTASIGRFGWQIVAYRFKGDRIVFEKSEMEGGENVDLLTVDETVPLEKLPAVKQKDIALENSRLNLEVQQALVNKSTDGGVAGDEETVTFDEEYDIPPNRLYRYRLVTLPPGHPVPGKQNDKCRLKTFRMAVRGEVHGVTRAAPETGKPNLIAIHCLTEGLIKTSTSTNWSQALERHKAALLLSEMRKNSCRVSKWIIRALIAGAQTIKIAFVSRKQQPIGTTAVLQRVLTVQSSKVNDMVTLMGLKVANGWGVVRSILDIICSDNAHDEGRYIITRDALAENVRISYAPLDF